jgi:hypothetical protein
MRNIYDLGYFERQLLIDRVGRAIAKAQGWQVDFDGNILEATNPRLHSYAALAEAAIAEIEAYTSEVGKEEDDSSD